MPLDLARYLERAAADRGGLPIPLIATDIRVRIAGGLAVVTTNRRFRNDEPRPIEATMTFPVPVHATLFELSAEIDGRRVRASAQRRDAARASYEDALDRGKTTVLHEEVLRGIHMLSLGQVAPGKQVIVTAVWAMPLSVAGTALSLRIPTTCGDVYGASPLPASDDLLHDPAVVQEATLEVACDGGTVELAGGGLHDGRARVRLDHPIDILVSGAVLRPVPGIAADQRHIVLSIEPHAAGEQDIDVAILVDRSGSMGEAAARDMAFQPGGKASMTKCNVIKAGLVALAGELRGSDRLRLWQFDSRPELVADVPGDRFGKALARLGPPQGGTETGAAIAAVLAGSATRDVLLITDGQSHALDVQAAARSGRRFTVVLVGEGALEARVGHLAALTGGMIFLATDDAETALRQAFAAMRGPHATLPAIAGAPTHAEARLGGMCVCADWTPPEPNAESAAADDCFGRAAAAVGAAIAIPCMAEQEAATLAEAEGIVCHLHDQGSPRCAGGGKFKLIPPVLNIDTRPFADPD